MGADERRLIAAARAGDRAAFDALYARYAGRVFAFARQLTGCASEAEDLTQEAFVAAFQGLERFRGQSTLLTWLLGIVVRRRRDRQRRPTLSPTVPDDSHGDDLAQRTVTGIVLHDALASLSGPLREAFLLVAGQGLTHREAAAVLGTPLGTVKWRVAEATRRLRAALREDDEEEQNDVSPLHR